MRLVIRRSLGHHPVHRYATLADKTRGDGPALTLEHFVQRYRTLQFWRSVVRAINKIPNDTTRAEMLHFARSEIEHNRYVHDISHIRYLLSTGKTQLDSMLPYIERNR